MSTITIFQLQPKSMKKLILTMGALMMCAITAHAQYYPFGTDMMCECQEGDSLAYVEAQNKLRATMDLYQYRGGCTRLVIAIIYDQ